MSDIFQEVDVFSAIKQIGSSSKKVQAKILQEVEKAFPKDSVEYDRIRKVILDEINGLTRTMVRRVFGNIEYLIE